MAVPAIAVRILRLRNHYRPDGLAHGSERRQDFGEWHYTLRESLDRLLQSTIQMECRYQPLTSFSLTI